MLKVVKVKIVIYKGLKSMFYLTIIVYQKIMDKLLLL